VEVLPLELQRNYTLIRQLDESAQQLMDQVAKETAKVTTIAKKMTAEEKKKALNTIGQLLNEVIKRGEEKYALAKSTYDTVDRHCTKLDDDLQKIEDEQMVGSTRVSEQTPTAEKGQSSQGESRRGRKKRTREEDYTSDSLQNSVSFSNMPIDPNEPRYCYCQRVSFGEMVACDNEECDIEWFHLECTELESVPKGAWFCKHCSANKKKKKH
jgi:hypothetical protein